MHGMQPQQNALINAELKSSPSIFAVCAETNGGQMHHSIVIMGSFVHSKIDEDQVPDIV